MPPTPTLIAAFIAVLAVHALRVHCASAHALGANASDDAGGAAKKNKHAPVHGDAARERASGWSLCDALYDAVSRCDAHTVAALMKAEAAQPQKCKHAGYTLLHHAAAEGDTCASIAESLMAAGVPPNVVGDGGGGVTPLHYLAMNVAKNNNRSSARMVALLVARGARVGARTTKDTHTPLHSAAKVGNQGAAAALLEYGADVNAVAPRVRNCTPLHEAARLGDADVIQLLLHSGASVDAMLNAEGDRYPQTALGLAAQHGLDNVARVLLDAGANVLLRDRGGHDYTALHHAVMAGHEPVVELLLQRGADPNSPCCDLRAQPLLYAALHGHAHLMPLLVQHGAE
jgi:ankyrin repeat protein